MVENGRGSLISMMLQVLWFLSISCFLDFYCYNSQWISIVLFTIHIDKNTVALLLILYMYEYYDFSRIYV